MTSPEVNDNRRKYFQVFFSIVLIIGFFIPWVSWDGINISGADMPLGYFFMVSEKKFQFANPFPQFNFAVSILWLIPAFAVIGLVLIFLTKTNNFVLAIAGILALGAATFFILFTNILAELGIKHSLQIGIYATFLSAASLILLSSYRWIFRVCTLVTGPLLVWISFYSVSNYLQNEKFEDTALSKPDFTVNALDFIREFENNDSLANSKYMEKIITMKGRISSVERPGDSTVNVKFSDSTGSYAIFPFEGQSFPGAASLKEGDSVSVKGSCSGVVYSEILGAYFISFKRSVLNKR